MIFHITVACPACDGYGTVERHAGRDVPVEVYCSECLGEKEVRVCEPFYETEDEARRDYPGAISMEKIDEDSSNHTCRG